jgi:hypothetical protein
LRFGTPIDPSRVEAVYRNGLLLITLPKSEHAKPRQVRVQVAEGSRQQHNGHSQPMTGQSQMSPEQMAEQQREAEQKHEGERT